jgi:hypothetical protein
MEESTTGSPLDGVGEHPRRSFVFFTGTCCEKRDRVAFGTRPHTAKEVG